MALYRIDDKAPQVAASAYIAAEATLIGAVSVGERATILAGAVARADNEPIVDRHREQRPGRRGPARRPGLSADDRHARHRRPPGDAARLHDRRRRADRHPGGGDERRGHRQRAAWSAPAPSSPRENRFPSARSSSARRPRPCATLTDADIANLERAASGYVERGAHFRDAPRARRLNPRRARERRSTAWLICSRTRWA